jgi:cytochrome P450
MMRDEEQYPMPEEFLPERFMGQADDNKLNPSNLIFGFGRR